MLTDTQMQALDRMEQIAACWQAVSDLMSPDGDLQSRQRDHLATLLDFLTGEYQAAQKAFSAAALAQPGRMG